MLLDKRIGLEKYIEEIKVMLSYMFEYVFKQRSQDTLPEIRDICISEIDIWQTMLSNKVQDNSSLKDICRMLSNVGPKQNESTTDLPSSKTTFSKKFVQCESLFISHKG